MSFQDLKNVRIDLKKKKEVYGGKVYFLWIG